MKFGKKNLQLKLFEYNLEDKNIETPRTRYFLKTQENKGSLNNFSFNQKLRSPLNGSFNRSLNQSYSKSASNESPYNAKAQTKKPTPSFLNLSACVTGEANKTQKYTLEPFQASQALESRHFKAYKFPKLTKRSISKLLCPSFEEIQKNSKNLVPSPPKTKKIKLSEKKPPKKTPKIDLLKNIPRNNLPKFPPIKHL